jgi:glutaryl-CoA dehydrogenase
MKPNTQGNKPLPVADGDFYMLARTLSAEDNALRLKVREFMEQEVQPVINDFWERDEFPFELLPKFKALGIGGLPFQGYGCPGKSTMLMGFLMMEIARVDASFSTFFGVHTGLAMGSIFVCGSEEQKQRWLPAMARMDKIGSFGLTEPDVGSGTGGGLTTTCRREGDTWILNGQKKWIGNAPWGDVTIIWARDVADDQVKGFIVENKLNPGFQVEKIRHKMALRVVQNGLITLTDCRVPEADRLQKANSFRDTALVLRQTRAAVAWESVGCATGASEHALRYAQKRSAAPSRASSSCRTCSRACWATSPRLRRCAFGCRRCRRRESCATSTPRWPRACARFACARPWAGRASSSARTASCSITTSDASSPTPRRCTRTKARAR